MLRTPADPVRGFDRDLAALVRDLEETVDHPGRAGLAAPQIGVSLRVFSYNVDGEIGHLVNPVITELSEETQDDDEGCLSVPGLYAPTVRAMHCVVEGVRRARRAAAAGGQRADGALPAARGRPPRRQGLPRPAAPARPARGRCAPCATARPASDPGRSFAGSARSRDPCRRGARGSRTLAGVSDAADLPLIGAAALRARAAARVLRTLPTDVKDAALAAMADALVERADECWPPTPLDVEAARADGHARGDRRPAAAGRRPGGGRRRRAAPAGRAARPGRRRRPRVDAAQRAAAAPGPGAARRGRHRLRGPART